MSLTKYIIVRGQYEGYHEWADAPVEVGFLQNEHRHMFKWEAKIQVFHDDRELEFFMVKHQLETDIAFFVNASKQRHLGSCEMQAQKILDAIQYWYGYRRRISVTVSEDGESDGVVVYKPDS